MKNENKKLTLEEALNQAQKGSFKQEDNNKKEFDDATNPKIKKAGRPNIGKTKATHKIAFVVDDEQIAYLKNLINYDKKLSTPSAVAKHLFVRDYDLHK